MPKRFAKSMWYSRRHGALPVTSSMTAAAPRAVFMTPTARGIIHARIRIYKSLTPRRGAGVAEQGCLLSSYPGKTGIGGSNPPLSAINESHPHLEAKQIHGSPPDAEQLPSANL